MTGYDLDHPLRLDSCDRCAALNWRECICSSSRPFRQPSQAELEAARRTRLTRAELAAEAVDGELV